jgi:RNA polymerase sigma-70 factor (ECF subfamily)
VKAYESLSRFRGQSSFATWLYRIAHNHCMDMLRQKTRRKTDSWDALLENHPEGSPALPSTSEKNPVSEEDRELVSNVLSSLRREHREILMLREVGGFTYDEIASSLECSLDAVKARLRRARLEMMEKARHFLGSKIV